MASYTKFNQFVTDLLNGKHQLQGGTPAHTLKVALSNVGPNAATNAIFTDITEIAAGNGYSAGGSSTTNTSSPSGGVETVNGVNVTWTAGPSAMATFRYVVLYNSTQTTPNHPLVAFWDNSSGVTLNNGDTFTVKFNNGAANGTIFTLS